MDDVFFQELEASLTNVGSDTVWKRSVGGVLLWFAPLTMTGQGKVAEFINSYSGSHGWGESKRVTLSHSIVGIGETDLRSYRDGAPAFPSVDREKKPIKVALNQYLFGKMAGWGSTFVDDAFKVYADMMESIEKQNLRDVKFENTKDPKEELGELMAKVAELRDQLGLKALVDPDEDPRYAEKAAPDHSGGDGDDGENPPAVPAAPSPEPRRAEMPSSDPVPSFDPFSRSTPFDGSDDLPPPRPRPEPSRPSMDSPPPMASTGPLPAPVVSRPAVPGPIHRAMPSVPSDVIEEQTVRAAVAPPPIDKPQTNRNPRFSAPGGR